MPTVTLTIRDVPVELYKQLEARAESNHQSLQRELLATLQASCTLPLKDLRDLRVKEDRRPT